MTARETWLAERKTGLGGSDAAAVCGQSEWRTPLAVYLSKTGEEPDSDQTPDQYRGTLLEPAVRQMYADATGLIVETPRGIIRHPKLAFILGSLDGIASGRRVVDFKTARSRRGWGEPGTDEVPTDYLYQTQHYMAVTGLPVADVAVLFGSFDFEIYTVEADAEFQEMMLAAELEFWRRVQEREPPEPSDARDALRLYPSARVGVRVTATNEIAAMCGELQQVKYKLQTLEDLEDTLAANIKAHIGAADTLCGGDGKQLATWKNTKGRTRFDTDAFRNDHPELFNKYLRDGNPSRRFLLKGAVQNGDSDRA